MSYYFIHPENFHKVIFFIPYKNTSCQQSFSTLQALLIKTHKNREKKEMKKETYIYNMQTFNPIHHLLSSSKKQEK